MDQSLLAYTLATDALSITVLPEIGAKIVSFRHLLTGREWMWRPRADAELFRNRRTDSFKLSPLIGADECLPTIAGCRWNGLDLPDHGEVWGRPWHVDSAALHDNRIVTFIRLDLLPLELERSISLRENQAIFDYVLRSRSTTPETFLWAFHPLMPLEEGDRIQLPPEIQQVRIGALEGFPMPRDEIWRWPAPLPDVRLDCLDFGSYDPAYAKLFADFTGMASGFAAVRRQQERLCFYFEPAQIPILGIWMTRGAWNGYTHLALEPTNAATDSLCNIVQNQHTTVAPGESFRWNFRMAMEAL